jgi:hypothetical protein
MEEEGGAEGGSSKIPHFLQDGHQLIRGSPRLAHVDCVPPFSYVRLFGRMLVDA